MSDVMVRNIYNSQFKTIRRTGVATDWTGGVNFNIFGIYNACILVRRIWGYVRVACANNILVPFLNFTPVGGVGASALCTLAAGAAHAANVILTWSGIAAGVLTPTAALGHSAVSGTATETWTAEWMILVPGIISITNAPVDATAVIDWYMTYTPGDPSASVTVL